MSSDATPLTAVDTQHAGSYMKQTKPVIPFPDPAHDHSPCVADTLQRAERVYEALGMRLTPLRRQVLNEIAGSHAAVGAYDVLERLSRHSGRRLAPISVYRALDSLVETGLVHRLESRNAFFACHAQHAGSRRQIVLACEGCSAVAEVASEMAFEEIGRIAAASRFVPTRMMVEVSGRCERCSKAPEA